MQALLRFADRIDGFHRALARVVLWLVLAMVLVGAFHALARSFLGPYGASLSLNTWSEAQWYLFSLVFLLAAPDALRLGQHVRVDVLYGAHGRRAKAWIDLCGAVLLLVPFCLLAVALSVEFVWNSVRDWEQSPDPGGLPRWILKPVLPVAFALLALQGVAEAIRQAALLRAPASGAEAEAGGPR